MVNKEILNVQKRNGRGSEPLNIEKIHEMVEYACEDITGVSSSQVEMSSGLQFYDGMTTDEIQKILIKSASDLISLDNPNYQYVAARLLLYSLRKQIFRRLWDHPHIFDHVNKCVDKGITIKKFYHGTIKKILIEWKTGFRMREIMISLMLVYNKSLTNI
jgi:ribonucleoside-diphosphate reductase alpha chain